MKKGIMIVSNKGYIRNDTPLPGANAVTTPPVLYVDTPATGSYIFSSPTGLLEDNEPLYAEELEIQGLYHTGEVLTAVINDLVIPNGASLGACTYRWYRCFNTHGGTETLVHTSTNNQYTIDDADSGFFLRVECDLVQSFGGNLNGDTIYSDFSPIILSDTFFPSADIEWGTALLYLDAVNFNSTSVWLGRGKYGDAYQDGTANVPFWDDTEQALWFRRINSERLLMVKQNCQQPFEIWMDFKCNGLLGSQYLIGLGNSSYIFIDSSGFIRVNQGTSVAQIVAGTWYVMRVVFNGASTTIELNNQAPITTTGSNAFQSGAGNARMGSSFSKANHFNGYIKNFFMRQEPLDSTQQLNMWNWFSLLHA